MIYQGQTTNESFKWASVVLTHKRLLNAHKKYLKLSRPENIEKIELTDRENEKMTDAMERSGRCDESLDLNVPIDADENSNIDTIINKNGGDNEIYNNNDPQEGFDNMINGVNDYGVINTTKQRSDSTFDGAPSAIDEEGCNSIMRKEGSSSSGSTSSSRSNYHNYSDNDNDDNDNDNNDDNDDENTNPYDDDYGDNIYLKDSEFDNDGNSSYLEVCTKNQRNDKQLENEEQKEDMEETEKKDIEEIVELHLHSHESQRNESIELLSNGSQIETESNEKNSKDTYSALESQVAKMENEKDLPVGCVPSAFPSKYSLPDSEFIFPEYLSKHPGPLPRNYYKKGFFLTLRNVINPPSELALRLLREKNE